MNKGSLIYFVHVNASPRRPAAHPVRSEDSKDVDEEEGGGGRNMDGIYENNDRTRKLGRKTVVHLHLRSTAKKGTIVAAASQEKAPSTYENTLSNQPLDTLPTKRLGTGPN